MATTLKIIDFAPIFNGSPEERVRASKDFVAALKETGFLYITNHGLQQEKIDGMFDWCRKLFSQPLETKLLAPHPESGTHHRGYSAPGREKGGQMLLDNDDAYVQRRIPTDIKESFEVGKEDSEDMPNIWYPEGVLPGFREASLDFFWAFREVQLTVLRALALGFDLEEEYFFPFHALVENQLRLLHYPSVERNVLEDDDSTRISKHTDFCTMTLTCQGETDGLQAEDPKQPGTFIPIPPIPGTIVVNAADFLMRWSNDTIRSSLHTVKKPSRMTEDGKYAERYSIPYFCQVDMSKVIDSIPGTWSKENPKKYEPVSAREYVMKRLALNY